MRLHRLIAILLLLESRGLVKAKELAGALETSERTIYRDIDILCESGLPIVAATGPAGGFALMEGYTASLNKLRSDEVISLFVCGIGLHPTEQSEAESKLKKTLSKLETILPPQYRPDIQTARRRFYFDPSDWFRDKPLLRHMDSIRQAVWHSRKLRVQYVRSDREATVRTVRPYGLVVKSQDWYLVAYCEKRKAIRSFKCTRIMSAVLLEEGFVIPEDFSLEHFWRENVRGFKAALNEKEFFPVRLQTDQAVDLTGLDWILIDQRLEMECRIWNANLYSLEHAVKTLWPVCDSVTVVSPVELRRMLAAKAKATLELCRDDGMECR